METIFFVRAHTFTLKLFNYNWGRAKLRNVILMFTADLFILEMLKGPLCKLTLGQGSVKEKWVVDRSHESSPVRGHKTQDTSSFTKILQEDFI